MLVSIHYLRGEAARCTHLQGLYWVNGYGNINSRRKTKEKDPLTQLTGDPAYPSGKKPTDATDVSRVIDFVPVLGEHAFLCRT